MSIVELVILFVSGTLAGIINTVVGSGSLVTFPALLALGYPPILANVTNNVGVLPGSVSGAIAYGKELRGQVAPAALLSSRPSPPSVAWLGNSCSCSSLRRSLTVSCRR